MKREARGGYRLPPMARSYLDPPLPIVALATVPGKSALAVLRASGAGCVELLSSCFSGSAALLSAPGRSLVHGRILDPGTRESIDDVIVAVFRAPRSPTGEDQVEISCHGSPSVVRRILACLGTAGFAQALPGEFSFRAFANGKGDLVKAEAVDEIVAARSEGARAAAMSHLEGGLSQRLERARADLLDRLAEADVRLDHAEEDGSPATLFPRASLGELRDDLHALATSWKAGRLLREGATVVLAGRTNAGKSSLFNLLLREERALVSPAQGTTRDWIEAGLEVAGYPVRLIDTAGLRDGTEDLEARGIERSLSLIAGADVVVCLADATRGPGPEEEDLLASRPDALRAWNKVDLAEALPCPGGWIPLSARSGFGLAPFLEALGEALQGLAGPADLPARRSADRGGGAERADIVANPRQKALLDRAVAALDSGLATLDAASCGGAGWLDALALDLRDAADALGEITGEISTAEVLEAIFSGFCLGK